MTEEVKTAPNRRTVVLTVWLAIAALVLWALLSMSSCMYAEKQRGFTDMSAPTQGRLSRDEMLNKVRTELNASNPMQALETIRNNATPEMLQSDEEVRALRDRAIAAGNAEIAPQQAAGYVERINSYWTEKLDSIAVEDVSTAPELLQVRAQLQDCIAALEPPAVVADKPEIKKAHDLYKKRLQDRQSQLYPAMRKQYGKIMATVLWRHDIYAEVQGRTLILTGIAFAANANVADTQAVIGDNAAAFRFTKVRYRTSPNGRSLEYDIDSPVDMTLSH